MRDTAPPPTAPGPTMSTWARAGLMEATKRVGESPWSYGFSPR
jgi:hypothetical protein